jgi:hypothetical protein
MTNSEAQLPIMTNAEEQALFRACTIITVGDGAKIKFWHNRWLHNQSPREVAPGMYKLVWRKNITVAKAMDQRNGTPARTEEIHQFVALWQQLHSFHLTDGDDEIVGKFSSNGSYSSRSAYKIQFAGTFPRF